MQIFWHNFIRPVLDLLKAKGIVEIGSDNGANTVNLLEFAQASGGVVEVIDPESAYDPSSLTAQWGETLRYHKKPSLDVLPFLRKFDAILIDGDHNWYTVWNELEVIRRVSESKNFAFPMVIMHDMTWPYAYRDLYYVPNRIPDEFRHSWEKKGMIPDSSVLVENEGLNAGFCNAVKEGGSKNGVMCAVEDFLKAHKDRFSFQYVPGFHGLGFLFERSLCEKKPALAAFLKSFADLDVFGAHLGSLERARLDLLIESSKYKLERDQEFLAKKKLIKQNKFLQREVSGDRGVVINEGNDTLNERLVGALKEVAKKESQVEKEVAHNKQLQSDFGRVQRNNVQLRRELDQRCRSDEQLLKERDRLLGESRKAQLLDALHSSDAVRIEILERGNSLRRAIELKKEWIEELSEYYARVVQSLGWRIGGRIFGKLGRFVTFTRSSRLLPWAPDHIADNLGDFYSWREEGKSLEITSELLRVSFVDESNDSQLSHDYVNQLQSALQTEKQRIERLERVNSSLGIWLNNLLCSLEVIYCSRRYRFAKWVVDKGIKRMLLQQSRIAMLPSLTQAVRHRFEGAEQNQRFDGLVTKQAAVICNNSVQSPEKPMIIQYIPDNPKNPYYSMLPNKLSDCGWHVEYDRNPVSVENRIESRGNKECVIHFHQLEPYYHSREGSFEETQINAVELVKQIKRFKKLGAKLVWTKHNPLPHDRQFQEIDETVISSVLPLVDEVVVLGRNAKVAFEKSWQHHQVSVVCHPSYQFHYGGKIGRTLARERLNLPQDSIILGHIGHIKAYKGLETVIEAFSLARSQIDMDMALLIAGETSQSDYVELLQANAGEGVIIRSEHIGDVDLNLWMGALDASLFAFKDIWASSSVVLSLSHGVPVVVPQLGCLPEYVSHGNNGYLYRHDDVEDFAQMIIEIVRSTDLYEHYDYMCDRFNREFSVTSAAKDLEAVYFRAIM